jgi:hypothetical protein
MHSEDCFKAVAALASELMHCDGEALEAELRANAPNFLVVNAMDDITPSSGAVFTRSRDPLTLGYP